MMHGYECLSKEDYLDRQEITFLVVSKEYITMGGEDHEGCRPANAGPCLRPGKWYMLFLYIPGIFYMFCALAIICDEFFVPSLEMFVEHYSISMDIAGATFMAAGGSMPELFTSLIAVFQESDVGMAAIIGSAVFNVLFVIAVCALASREPLQLTAWPLARDCSFYVVSLALIVVFNMASSQGMIEWWEALILFCWYCLYCGFMTVNEKVKKWFDSKCARRAVLPETDENLETARGELNRQNSPSINLKMPSKFRSGIVKLLTQHASLTETAGIAVVTEMKCSLQEAFQEMDQDGDDLIDEAEFNLFMQKLGWHPPSDDEIREDTASKLWKRMPLTKDDKLAFEDFRRWYIVSEARIEIEVRRVFERLDRNGDGILDKDEISQLLLLLGHRPTVNELQEVLAEITQMSATEGEEPVPNVGCQAISVKFEQFERWYSKSMFCEQKHRMHEMEIGEELGFSIEWPDEDATNWQLFWYFFTYPICAALYCTLPDVRRPGMEGRVGWAVVEFLLSLVWIGIFSEVLYECTVVTSNSIGIPEVVSALTVLAAGTSVPDLLSSYIVARQGEGDMAVSSSIGSNIFDVTVGLPIPWMLYSIVNGGKSVKVETKSLYTAVLILIIMLLAVVLTVMAMKWRMAKQMGIFMLLLYVVFIVVNLLMLLPPKDPLLGFLLF